MFCSETIRLSRPNGATNHGKPGGRQKNLVIGAGDREPQCRHVLERLMIKAIEFLVAGADLEHRPQPVRHVFGVVRFLMFAGALVRRRKGPVAVFQRIEQAAMPGSPGSRSISKLSRPLA